MGRGPLIQWQDRFLPTIEWGKGEMIKRELLLTRLLVKLFSRYYWETSDTRDWGWEKRTQCKTTLLIYSSESHQLAYLIYFRVILETSRTFHLRPNFPGLCTPICPSCFDCFIRLIFHGLCTPICPSCFDCFIFISFWYVSYGNLFLRNPHDWNFSRFNPY